MDNTFWYSFLPLLPLLIGFYLHLILGRKNGGVSKPAIFYLLLLGIYLVYVPITDRLLGINSFFGFDLLFGREIDSRIALIYSLVMVSFSLGSLIPGFCSNRNSVAINKLQGLEKSDLFGPLLYGWQILVWGFFFFNLRASGISILGVFDPFNSSEQAILFSAAFRYPLLDLCTLSVPVCLFLLLQSGRKLGLLWWVFLIFWLVISILGGWRFRVILFVLFLVFWQLPNVYRWKVLLSSAIILSLVLTWLTLNRMAIAKRQFDLITFDLTQFDPALFNAEFSNSRTFRATLSAPGSDLVPGIKGWMKSDKSTKPWILEISKAWIPAGWPWNPNPAFSQPEEFYLLFGLFGMSLAMFIIGIWTGFLGLIGGNRLSDAFQIVCTSLLFQWVSRGYFIFQLKISLVCLFPFLLLWILKPYLSGKINENPA